MKTKVKLTVKEPVYTEGIGQYHPLAFFFSGIKGVPFLGCIALQEEGASYVSLFSRDWEGFVRVDIAENGDYFTYIHRDYDAMIAKYSGSLFVPVSFKVTFKTRED